jgi:hypothetical protein
MEAQSDVENTPLIAMPLDPCNLPLTEAHIKSEQILAIESWPDTDSFPAIKAQLEFEKTPFTERPNDSGNPAVNKAQFDSNNVSLITS